MANARILRLLAMFGTALLAAARLAGGADQPLTVRVATFNVEDIRTEQIIASHDEKLQQIADIILEIEPDIILLNEIQFDHAGGGSASGKNAQRFADVYLNEGPTNADSRKYVAFMAPSNTGQHSGHDLDNNGKCDPNGSGRDYGGDCLGYGEIPGQYAMALLVRAPHTILQGEIRTFRKFLWKDLPRAQLPPSLDESGKPRADQSWYSPAELSILPLSSKSHWDVPVKLSNGSVIHVLACHPTPPVFDGAEDRNGRRNHDEIRFFGEYISGAAFIRDDNGKSGSLPMDATFVILGDLNADPEADADRGSPMNRWILQTRRVAPDAKPVSKVQVERLQPGHTARFRLRVDYVIPSADCRVVRAAVWRGPVDSPTPETTAQVLEMPSDHFPVWADLEVPSSVIVTEP